MFPLSDQSFANLYREDELVASDVALELEASLAHSPISSSDEVETLFSLPMSSNL